MMEQNIWLLSDFNILIQIHQMTQSSFSKQPPTIQQLPWGNFPKLRYSFINDQFVHDHRATIKVNLRDAKGGVSIKQNINQSQKGYSVNDETRFWFYLPGNRSLYAKIKSGQNTKLHYDNSTTEIFGKSFNLYGTLNFNRQLQHQSFKLGAAHLGKYCQSDNRIKFDLNNKDTNITWYHKTLVSTGKWKFGIIDTYNYSKDLLGKNSLLIGYDVDQKTSIFLRAQNEKIRSPPGKLRQWRYYYNNIFFDIINKYDAKTQIGLEFIFQTHGCPFKETQLVLQRQGSNQITYKLKATTNFNIQALIKAPINFIKQNSFFSLGIHGSARKGEKKMLQYGAQVEINL